MGSMLLIGFYNVGCRVCIYGRILNGSNDFHILIDCGSKESVKSGVMKRSIKYLEDNMLPESDIAGKKRLDLVVVSYRH